MRVIKKEEDIYLSSQNNLDFNFSKCTDYPTINHNCPLNTSNKLLLYKDFSKLFDPMAPNGI